MASGGQRSSLKQIKARRAPGDVASMDASKFGLILILCTIVADATSKTTRRVRPTRSTVLRQKHPVTSPVKHPVTVISPAKAPVKATDVYKKPTVKRKTAVRQPTVKRKTAVRLPMKNAVRVKTPPPTKSRAMGVLKSPKIRAPVPVVPTGESLGIIYHGANYSRPYSVTRLWEHNLRTDVFCQTASHSAQS